MNSIRRIITLFIIFILLVAGAGSAFIYNSVTRVLPKTDGVLNVTGLDGRVLIYRDTQGVPQIYASTTHDLFYAQGLVHAQDRWWQMEFNRHTGEGRISELTGKNDSALSSDIFIRTVGWNRAAQADVSAAPKDTLDILNAYSDGVNEYIGGRSEHDLALEYLLLEVKGVSIPLETWKPVDSLAWGKVMAWSLSGNMSDELERTMLYEKLGPDAHNMVDNYYAPPYPFDQRPTIIDAQDLSGSVQAPRVEASDLPGMDLSNVQTTLAGGVPYNFGPIFGKETGVGSNNWVISGRLTKSGKPLLANDPHLAQQIPPIWYENGLHCLQISQECPYDVTGFSLPGVPGIIIGHNQRIAWGMTNVGPDTQDLYTIKVDPNDDTKYVVDGKTLDMQVLTETINFGDKTPAQNVRVRVTRFGPIITDTSAFAKQSQVPLALHWTAISQPNDLLGSVMAIDRATDWQTFRQALTRWAVPSQNFIYADVNGNIGYQTPGLIPIRTNGHSGLIPIDGSTTKYDWKGFIPFDYLPHVYNPTKGYIVTANNAVVPPGFYDSLAQQLGDKFGSDSNYAISLTWDYGYRSQRINQLIKGSGVQSVDTVKAIQGDNYNGSAAEILPAVLKLDFGSDVPKDVLAWMGQWDYQDSIDSGQAALYEAFWAQLTKLVWGTHMGYTPDGTNVAWGTRLLLDQPNNSWWDDPTTTDKKETRDDDLRAAFSAAYKALSKQLGADYKTWKWGALHTVTFVNKPIGASGIDLLERLFNNGPVAVSGGSNSINRTNWEAADPYATDSISSMRMIVDLSDFDNSLWIMPTGESGHPLSAHYRDMTDNWRNIRYTSMAWDEATIKSSAASTLLLQPN